uniref:Chemokine interleukin-8-like domain-containing protein n=1 Tax=Sinocyclocheilus anshuiensis TaxID=1608454 RepID=A0A671NSN1_9TELE
MHYCILISCLVIFAFCSLAQSKSDPDKCCFSFSNLEIPEREVESYYMTNLECPRHAGIVKICLLSRKERTRINQNVKNYTTPATRRNGSSLPQRVTWLGRI